MIITLDSDKPYLKLRFTSSILTMKNYINFRNVHVPTPLFRNSLNRNLNRKEIN